jgi:hypothetical protein
MSYIPGTILSVGFGETLEQVTVLTGDKIATKTFGGKPVSRRDIMSLDDWKILVAGQDIVTDYLQMPRPAETFAAPPSGRGYLADLHTSAAGGSSSAILELSSVLRRLGVTTVGEAMAMTTLPASGDTSCATTPTTAIAATSAATSAATIPEPVSYPTGTKLTWVLPEEDGSVEPSFASNSRTAIVLKDGILQVREVINGVTVKTPHPIYSDSYMMTARKFFSSLADWQQQLPAGGTVISTARGDCNVLSIKRKASKVQSYKATSDADYIREIQKTYSIYSKIEYGKTSAQLFSENIGNIRGQMELLNTMTSKVNTLRLDKDALLVSEEMMKIDAAARKLRRASRKANSIMRTISSDTSKANTVPQWFVNNYKQRLMAFVKGIEIELCCNRESGIMGLSGDPSHGAPYGHYFGYSKTGTTFAELGLDMKADGKPRLKVCYRRESIEL